MVFTIIHMVNHLYVSAIQTAVLRDDNLCYLWIGLGNLNRIL